MTMAQGNFRLPLDDVDTHALYAGAISKKLDGLTTAFEALKCALDDWTAAHASLRSCQDNNASTP